MAEAFGNIHGKGVITSYSSGSHPSGESIGQNPWMIFPR
jgi:hypothetical protein